MRGYFGIGVEGISKPHNLGNLLRSAHAFGASFFFTLGDAPATRLMRQSDTSGAMDHVPFTHYPDSSSLQLPHLCELVAVELTDAAIPLPSFRHPLRAAYVFGREKGSVSPELLARARHVVKIPTSFCVNVGVAGAVIMYDRMISLGRFAERPVRAGGPPQGE